MKLDDGKPVISNGDLEIIFLLAEGNMASEIAEQMHYSLATIQGRIKELRAKVGARNSTQLVALAYHHGLLKGRQ